VLCAQDCHVFNTTIRETLLIARRDAYEQQIRDALAIVELEEWAAGLPHGLNTLMGQHGELASGGQRRRIALARFLILDEPTAHLDPALAQRVMEGLMKGSEDRGVLVITHDLTALERFDRVLHMRGGAVTAGVGRVSMPAAA
jgi:ATP-binding cassette subfamily C protein CydCD